MSEFAKFRQTESQDPKENREMAVSWTHHEKHFDIVIHEQEVHTTLRTMVIGSHKTLGIPN